MMFHVIYFGDQRLTGWISEVRCLPFEGLSSFPQLKTQPVEPMSHRMSLVSKRYQKVWEKAFVEADSNLKVRRNSRLRRQCVYSQNGEFRSSGIQKLAHDDVPTVSGHGAATCKTEKISVGLRKRCRSSAGDDTLCPVVSPKIKCYEQTEQKDSSGCLLESSPTCRVENGYVVVPDTFSSLMTPMSDCLSGDNDGKTMHSLVSDVKPMSQPLGLQQDSCPILTVSNKKPLPRGHSVLNYVMTVDDQARVDVCVARSKTAVLCTETRQLRSNSATASSSAICRSKDRGISMNNNTLRHEEPNNHSLASGMCVERRQLRSNSVTAYPSTVCRPNDEKKSVAGNTVPCMMYCDFEAAEETPVRKPITDCELLARSGHIRRRTSFVRSNRKWKHDIDRRHSSVCSIASRTMLRKRSIPSLSDNHEIRSIKRVMSYGKCSVVDAASNQRGVFSVDSERRRSQPMSAKFNTRKRNSAQFSPSFSSEHLNQRQTQISGMVRFEKCYKCCVRYIYL